MGCGLTFLVDVDQFPCLLQRAYVNVATNGEPSKLSLLVAGITKHASHRPKIWSSQNAVRTSLVTPFFYNHSKMPFSLVDAAAAEENPLLRIAFVAAFAMSNYSSTIGRIAKPFNPMLGETFEYVRFDKEYRYVSEQVSHHPPISACYAGTSLSCACMSNLVAQ